MNRNIIERLYAVCDTENLAEVSRMIGVPYNTLKNYTADNRRMPSAEVLMQIAQMTSVNLNWLLLGEGEMYSLEQDAKTFTPNRSETKPTKMQILDIEIPSIRLKVLIGSGTRHPATSNSSQDETELIPIFNTTLTEQNESEAPKKATSTRGRRRKTKSN